MRIINLIVARQNLYFSDDFFTHPFLHMPLPTSPSKRILDQALSHQDTYQPSSAQIKAKFPAFASSSPRSNPSPSRPIHEGAGTAPYHHRPYAPPAFINPGKVGSEGMARQAVNFILYFANFKFQNF